MLVRTIGLSLTGCLLAGAAAAQDVKLTDILPDTPGARACFTRSYDARHLREHPQQRVAGVTFLMRVVGFDDKGEWVLKPDGKYKYTRTHFAIRFARREGRRAQSTSGECQNNEKASASCYVECDGGGFGLEKSGEGLLLRLADDGIRIDDCDEKDVRLKPGRDDRTFRVEKVADAQCRALEKEKFGQ
jgi:hypothetical protein